MCAAQTHTASTQVSGAPSGIGQTSTDTSHCAQLAASDPRMSPLQATCKFALTYLGDLPNFICEQTTTSTGSKWITVSRAEVRFEQGHEHYSKVTIDGKPIDPSSLSASAMAFISQGEFGSDFVDLFKPPIVAEFKFRKDGRLGRIPSLIYEFHLATEQNTFWALRDDRGVTLHPEYEGELWLGRQDGLPVRLELRTVHLPEDFGFASAEITIDYREIESPAWAHSPCLLHQRRLSVRFRLPPRRAKRTPSSFMIVGNLLPKLASFPMCRSTEKRHSVLISFTRSGCGASRSRELFRIGHQSFPRTGGETHRLLKYPDFTFLPSGKTFSSR
jgi:hypothetical protein